MNVETAAALVLDVLNELGVPYVIVGAFSVNYHGIARSTQDVDFVAEFTRRQIAAIMEKSGGDFRLDPQMSFESATETLRYIVHYAGARGRPVPIEFFRLSDDEFDRQRLAREVQDNIFGRPAYFLTAEDVIVTKLRWYLCTFTRAVQTPR